MPEKTYGTIVTDLGLDLITQAVMEGAKVNITHLAVGDGGGAYYQPTADMTALKNETWRGAVNRVQVNPDSPNMIDVEAVIPSDVGGWTIREMAVMTDANDMVAICNTPDTEKVIITSGAAGEISVIMHIEISNASAISFVIDPSVVTATKKDIEDHDKSPTAHAELFDKMADLTDMNNHINNTDIHVNPSTMANYDTAIAGLIDHTENADIHVTAAEKAGWTAGKETADQAAADIADILNQLADIDGRVDHVEESLFSNITANPFSVSFDSLDGIVLTAGVWNATSKRLEC